jgi:regulator of protease activity HflC (stomatin/prohibitin superfamily)
MEGSLIFQPIFDAIVYLWEFIQFWDIISQYEVGIVMRLGNYNRRITSKNGICHTGLHLTWPFGIEHTLDQIIIPDTTALNSQSLTTSDGVGITVEVVVKFRVFIVEDYLLKVTDQEAAFADIAAAAVSDVVTVITYEDLLTVDILLDIKTEMQKNILPYGIEIQTVAFRTMQKCRTLRIINDAVPLIST